MTWLTVHRRPGGDQNAVRFVPDGFRWSVFLLPPAGLFARKLWIAGGAWLLLAALVAAGSVAGLLSPVAALLAILVVNIVFALDAPEMERRRLAKGGWPATALIGPRAAVDAAYAVDDSVAPMPVARVAPGPGAGGTDVLGLFPDDRRP